MKKILIAFSAVAIFFATGCTNVLDTPLALEKLDDVKIEVNKSDTYSPMKKKYIIDNLTMVLGFAELGKALNVDQAKFQTFRSLIDEYAVDFDSIRTAKIEIAKVNTMLDDFLELKSASSFSIDKYKGNLKLKFNFNNTFNREVLYTIFNYKFVDKYDTEYCNSNAKVTDGVAGSFDGEVELYTTEEYNKAAEWLYTKVPIKDKGEKYLMEGMTVECLKVVFKDKTFYERKDAEWEYME